MLYTIRPIDQVMWTDTVPEPKRIRHGGLEMEVLPVYPRLGCDLRYSPRTRRILPSSRWGEMVPVASKGRPQDVRFSGQALGFQRTEPAFGV